MPAASSIRYRKGGSDDLDACTVLWRTAIEDYTMRLAQPPMPDDLAPVRRMLAHLMATDPDRFWVALEDDDVAGFACASVRETLWFLAMLFVRPGLQARGIGAALMDRAQAARDTPGGGPAVPSPDDPLDSGIETWGMCTDSLQPISNALYARRGMVPRIPIWRLAGEVRRWAALPKLPPSLEVAPFENVAATEPDGDRRLRAILDDLDHEVIGVAHPEDHAYLAREGRTGFLVRERAGGRPAGYVYGSGGGRMGPMLALDPALHPALAGVAVRETPALGTVAFWVPGTADGAMRAMLDAGLRIDGFPGLVCWSRPGHPFDRYLPISLAIV